MGRKPKPSDAAAPLQDRLITVPEACGILGCGNTTGWLLLRQGLLPSVRCGARATRVRLSDVNRLVSTGWSLVRISKGRKGWEEDILDVFDAVLASTGDPKLAVRAALLARAERVSKIAPDVAKFVAQAISDSAAVA